MLYYHNLNNSSKSKYGFVFITKANVLEHLQTKLAKSKIEKLKHYTIQQWQTNPQKIIDEIQKSFSKSKFLIVRSSALGEDSLKSSYAGVYESILHVLPHSKTSIRNAIDSVAKSYIAFGAFLLFSSTTYDNPQSIKTGIFVSFNLNIILSDFISP